MGIELFDRDLKKRMDKIHYNELQFDFEKAEKRTIRRERGFVEHQAFPFWRSQHLEWIYRNKDRVNEYHRNYYIKHINYWKNYYLLNKEHIDAYHKRYYQENKLKVIARTLRNKIKRHPSAKFQL
jgi:hypothetical protein